MKPLLIIGIDSVAGANAAAYFSESREVSGYYFQQSTTVQGCHTVGKFNTINVPASQRVLADGDVGQLLIIPPCGQSSWLGYESSLEDSHVDDIRSWVIAAQKIQVPVTLISSDIVFTGPWMFHEEDSTSLNSSKQAVLARIIESEVSAWHPEALIVRTNMIGWSPEGVTPSWLENLTAGNVQAALKHLDTLRNGTPISATIFNQILDQAWKHHLNGIFHIAGAERCHPVKLAQKICETFNINSCDLKASVDVCDKGNRFGFGETSLQTRKIRNTLQVALPMVIESISQLLAEYQNGFSDKIRRREQRISKAA